MEGLNVARRVKEETIKLCIDYETTYIKVKNIVAFEKYRNKCTVYLSDGRTKECYETIKSLLEKLPNKYFYQTAGGMIVNISYITYIKGHELGFCFDSKDEMRSLGRKYYKKVNEAYLRELFIT